MLLSCALPFPSPPFLNILTSYSCTAAGGKAAREADLEAADSGHRALVFAQTRALLDLAQTCVLDPLGVASLRIDGGVDPAGNEVREHCHKGKAPSPSTRDDMRR